MPTRPRRFASGSPSRCRTTKTMFKRKIARIYLISDSAQLQCQGIERELLPEGRGEESAGHLQESLRLPHAVGQPSQSRGLQVARDERVQSVGGVSYPKDFLLRLQHTFLGIAIVSRFIYWFDNFKNTISQQVEKQPEEVPALLKGIADTDSSTPVLMHDIYNDGMPLNTTEDIDGVPMQSSEE
ncbi:uncharacterized protein LOC6049582 isoform X1 [Culex quinquefasciatus]|uniref:uncharacterized protein LOC6049582 isoform X1 n=1 Tax=Culex quinquefasciatus TaxID=7176 RepID=UPI0018E380FC|nr:uncharacterized protein LOC6049582 isoform X1 [Culex quinquefasciatus]